MTVTVISTPTGRRQSWQLETVSPRSMVALLQRRGTFEAFSLRNGASLGRASAELAKESLARLRAKCSRFASVGR